MQQALTGLWPPVSTPFTADGAVDFSRLVRHCQVLLRDGATGLAILGTTSEANSLTLAERRRVIDACVEAGIPAEKLLPGTGACALGDAVELSRHAGEIGCAGVLLLPPFYYKNVPDDGLFAFVGTLIERSGPRVPRIMLYHIPPTAIVGWPTDLVGRLIAAFPGIVAGMKDSSGDFDHVLAMISSFPGFAVFPGSELHLLRGMQAGAAGCISASANVNARGIAYLAANWRDPDAQRLQDEVNAVRRAVETYGLVPSNKAILAERYKDPVWRNVRPPLLPLDEEKRRALLAMPPIAALLEATPA